MQGLVKCWVCIGALLLSLPAYATSKVSESESINALLDNEQGLRDLAQHPQWQHLLFVKRGKGEVISKNFYLTAPNGGKNLKIDAYQEMKATLEAMADNQTLCRYPARYFWLGHQLGFEPNFSKCKGITDPKQAVSLILVSSYLKNPASTFGHVLIKTSKEGEVANSGNLLSDSYNYGASIPQNENGVMYALKGLFGFYNANFAKADFFTQDAVYAQNEQRDMWEYTLNLDDFSKALLNYHLQEISGAKFSYYFIKQNCGYRSGELLELVSGIKTTERVGGWYAPEFVFDELMAHDEKHPIVQEVAYFPSAQTQVRAYFKQLPAQLQTLVNAFIEKEDVTIFEGLDEAQARLALDFLIAHRNYKISQKNSEYHQKIKKKLVAQRLLLPVGNALFELALPKKHPPTMSQRTTKSSIDFLGNSRGVGVTMFSKHPLDVNTDLDKTFEAMKFRVAYVDDKVKLSNLDVLNIEQIENLSQPLSGEPKLSWRLKAGIEPDVYAKNEESLTYASAGVGAGGYVNDKASLLAFAFIDTKLHDADGSVDGHLEVGLRAKREKLSAQVAHQAFYRRGEWLQKSDLTLQKAFGMRHSGKLIFTHQYQHSQQSAHTDIGAAWQYYW